MFPNEIYEPAPFNIYVQGTTVCGSEKTLQNLNVLLIGLNQESSVTSMVFVF
jgi:hypothetical protein